MESPVLLTKRGFFSETQASEAKRTEACWSNYPQSEAHGDLRQADPELMTFNLLKFFLCQVHNQK